MGSLQAPRVITTSHTASGVSIISSDECLTPFHPFGPTKSGFAIFHSSPTVPVSNITRPAPAVNTIPRPAPGGTIFCTTDIPPNSSVPMHRTLSLDYCVVLSGSIWLTLDSGDETEAKPGEAILQRGTNHMWTNRGDVPCRIFFVMVGAELIKLADGTELEVRFSPPAKPTQ
jgi:hypothetical protein